MSTLRVQRVGELLKRAIGEAIQREIPMAQAGLITVNEVKPASDLRSARVFLGVIGKPEQRRRARTLLAQLRPRIQHDVAQSVVLRYTPVLRFEMDDTIERGNHVLEILREIEKTLPPDATPAVTPTPVPAPVAIAPAPAPAPATAPKSKSKKSKPAATPRAET